MADIARSELSTLIQDAYSNVLLDSALNSSVALQSFRRVDLGTKTTNVPVLATVPDASWVAESATASEGVKPTAEATWGNKQLVAEELAVIIPVHENAVDDATVDVLTEITRQGGSAIGRALDAAVLFGTNKPASWTSPALSASATANSLDFTVGATGTAADLGGSILKAAQGIADEGWDPDLVISRRGLRFELANLRTSYGEPIFLPSMATGVGATDMVAGMNAAWASGRYWNAAYKALVVDSSRVVIGVRQDITVKLLDQATVGGINLAERDMVALRFKARFAYVLGDNTNAEGNATQAPVAAVKAGS